jgi:hypothetical protein
MQILKICSVFPSFVVSVRSVVEPHELVEVAYFELISRPFFELFTTKSLSK